MVSELSSTFRKRQVHPASTLLLAQHGPLRVVTYPRGSSKWPLDLHIWVCIYIYIYIYTHTYIHIHNITHMHYTYHSIVFHGQAWPAFEKSIWENGPRPGEIWAFGGYFGVNLSNGSGIWDPQSDILRVEIMRTGGPEKTPKRRLNDSYIYIYIHM